MGQCMGGCVGYYVVQGVGSCRITKNLINHNLIEIIQFCLKIYDFWRHLHPIPPTQLPTPLGYFQISNNSIGLELIMIIEFFLKI